MSRRHFCIVLLASLVPLPLVSGRCLRMFGAACSERTASDADDPRSTRLIQSPPVIATLKRSPVDGSGPILTCCEFVVQQIIQQTHNNKLLGLSARNSYSKYTCRCTSCYNDLLTINTATTNKRSNGVCA